MRVQGHMKPICLGLLLFFDLEHIGTGVYVGVLLEHKI